MLKKLIILMIFFCVSLPVFGQSVDTAWVRRYNGVENGDDEASALAVDGIGNILVTGNKGTIKYDSAGNLLWTGSWGGIDIAIDNSGNTFVTGVCTDSGTYDYSTIKYYPNGDTAWVRRYHNTPPGLNGVDVATCITVDASGNVYVSGTSSEVSGAWFRMNYATLKYDSNGNMLWVSRYTPYEVKTADPTDLAVDDSGNVYVTGTVGNYPYTCYTTIKYNPQGKQLWRNTYNSPDYLNDRSSVIAVDGSHNVYVTGSTGTIKYDADGKQLWVGLWVGSDMRMDDLGNIYLAGGISGDFATIKYYPNGDTGWVRKYNGPGDVNDGANAMAMDCFRNIYVTGYSGNWPNDDYATIKYDSNGNQLWVQRYNGPANYWDQPSDITVDFSGNIYVTGKSAQNSVSPYNFDYLTIKYVQFLRGDVNYDRQVVVADIVYLVSYLFKHGPAPNPLMSGDANCDGKVTISDIVYLVAYLFKHGPQPCS